MMPEYADMIALLLKERWIFILLYRHMLEQAFYDKMTESVKEIFKDKYTSVYLENIGVFLKYLLLPPPPPQEF